MLARYMLKRVVHAVLVLLAVLIVVWILVNQIGDPARLILPPSASHQLYLDTRASLGLDDPLWEQFWRSFSGWLQADSEPRSGRRCPRFRWCWSGCPQHCS